MSSTLHDYVQDPHPPDRRLGSTSTNTPPSAMDPSSDPEFYRHRDEEDRRRLRMREQMIRLQVLTPVSVLVALGANLICAVLVKPSMGDISRRYPTLMTPKTGLILIYWAVLYVLEIGFCLLLVIARREETKAAIVKAVGLRFALAQWVMAAWAVFWTLEFFKTSAVFLLINLVIFITIYLGLTVWYPPSARRPLDWLFIHVPMKMYLVILLAVQFWHNGQIALGWVAKDERSWARYTWPTFGILLGVAILSSLVVLFTLDAVWTLSVVYLYAALLARGDKPAPVFAAIILGLVLTPVCWLAGMGWKRLKKRREGRVALPVDDEAEEEATASAAAREEQNHHRRAQRFADDRD